MMAIRAGVLALACLSAATAAWAAPPHPGFVYLDELAEPVAVELRYAGEENFIGERIDGYEGGRAVVTEEAGRALAGAAKALAEFGLGLKVFDGYRPQRAVDHFVRWAEDPSYIRKKAIYFPHVDKRHLFRDGYIAARSGHSRGSTVDVTIVDLRSGEELDMGTPFDFFGPQSALSDMSISPQARANRALLHDVMIANGFRSLPEEWWHFTLRNEPFPETYFDFPLPSKERR
jgi:D-alanyl-D-alanine dipeptidase